MGDNDEIHSTHKIEYSRYVLTCLFHNCHHIFMVVCSCDNMYFKFLVVVAENWFAGAMMHRVIDRWDMLK